MSGSSVSFVNSQDCCCGETCVSSTALSKGRQVRRAFRSRRARVAGRTGSAGSLPPCVGKCDSELWELGLESSLGRLQKVSPHFMAW